MKYFVTFQHLVAFTFVFGNAEVKYHKPIQGIDDIREIQSRIAVDMKIQNPIIVSFQRFENGYDKLN